MNHAATIALVSAVLATVAGLVALRLAAAPGSGEQRWFAIVSFAAAGCAAANVCTAHPVPPTVTAWISRLQFACIAVHVWGWLRYSQAFLGRTPERADRLAAAALFALAGASLVPGAMYGGGVVDRPFPALGVVYREALSSRAGYLMMAAVVVVASWVVVRFAVAWRAGVRDAGGLAVALATLVALGVNDAVATAAALPLPLLLDVGLVAPVLAVTWIMTSRFVESASALERLRSDLVVQVHARTRDLSAALDGLHQAEKLAALGQFASGVAHEVNNPAAVVTANLRYLADATASGGSPPDAPEALADALTSMDRINSLVRKLVDAGRLSGDPSGGAAEVAPAVSKALGDERARVAEDVRLDGLVPGGLHVGLRIDALEQVLEALLRNAGEAVLQERGGRVEVRAERADGLVRITIVDDGVGMPPEVLRRAFDPFFTTKPHGRGTGLGLPIARGLVESVGGALWLDSEPGRGTRAVLELPEAVRADEAH